MESISISEYKELKETIKKKKSKFGNKKVERDGHKFDSDFESQRYWYLKMLERAGKIKDLELQPKYELQPSFKKDGKTILAIYYKADFSYHSVETNKMVIEDTKGFKTKEYLIKKKMFEYKYPDLTIVEIEREKHER